jgi:hypothetical protein
MALDMGDTYNFYEFWVERGMGEGKQHVQGRAVRRPEQVMMNVLGIEGACDQLRAGGGDGIVIPPVSSILERGVRENKTGDKRVHPLYQHTFCLGGGAEYSRNSHKPLLSGQGAWAPLSREDFVDRVRRLLVCENRAECQLLGWAENDLIDEQLLRVRIYKHAQLRSYEQATSRLYQTSKAGVTSCDSSHVLIAYQYVGANGVEFDEQWLGQVAFFVTIEKLLDEERHPIDEAHPPLRFAIVDFFVQQQPYVDEDFGTLYLAQPGEWDDGAMEVSHSQSSPPRAPCLNIVILP